MKLVISNYFLTFDKKKTSSLNDKFHYQTSKILSQEQRFERNDHIRNAVSLERLSE